jgi:S1-C subfamily serine protease
MQGSSARRFDMYRRSYLVVALAAGFPGPLSAQEPVRGEVRPSPGAERVMQFVMSRRARLGLKVNLRARESDSVGAYVDAVTPNGPAAKAGLRSGDIITKVDGRSVLGGGEPAISRDARESLPGLRLIELAATLEPNDTIPVEFRRGKDTRTVSVVTADEPNISFRGGPDGRAFAFRYGPGARMTILDDDEILSAAPFLYGSSLAHLELAPLNSDLGQYFGATSGVLVISVPKDSELGFKGGDVVLAVDGRAPESPSHLLRILRSYADAESFKAEVLRNRKRVTVEGRLGEKPTR